MTGDLTLFYSVKKREFVYKLSSHQLLHMPVNIEKQKNRKLEQEVSFFEKKIRN